VTDIIINCEWTGATLDAKGAKKIEKALRDLAAQLFPEQRVRGLWVHSRSREAMTDDQIAALDRGLEEK
jgi:hypothetical protein